MNYILMTNGELYHHGIKGMRWGVRRYQNSDGSLTTAGKKRYEKEMAEAKNEAKRLKNIESSKAKLAKLESLKAANAAKKKAMDSKNDGTQPKKKSVKEMSDEELRAKINRLQMEQTYKNMTAPQQQTSKGKAFMKSISQTVLIPAASEIGRQVVKSLLTKGINKFVENEDLKIYTNNKKK